MIADPAQVFDFEKLFVSVDEMDTESFLSFITVDGSFRFGSAPAVRGHAAIREAVDGFFSSIAALKHSLRRTVTDDGAAFCEGEVTYTRHDGREISLPFVNAFEIEGGLISDYRIYIDVAPLFNP